MLKRGKRNILTNYSMTCDTVQKYLQETTNENIEPSN